MTMIMLNLGEFMDKDTCLKPISICTQSRQYLSLDISNGHLTCGSERLLHPLEIQMT
jgi:hypothetical protein